MSWARFKEALSAYEYAAELAPTALSPVVNQANQLVRLRRNPEAIEVYRRALTMSPDNLATITNIAALFESEGRFKAASTAVKKGLQLSRDNVALNLVAARLERHARQFDKALRRLQQMLDAEPNQQSEAAVLREVGLLQDAAGAFPEAEQAFKQANRITARLLRTTHDRAALLNAVRLQPQMPADPHLASDEKSDIQPLFIVGNPGSGTQYLARLLTQNCNIEINNERSLWREVSKRLSNSASGQRDDVLASGRTALGLSSTGEDKQSFVEVLSLSVLHIEAVRALFPRAHFVVLERDRTDTLLACLTRPHPDLSVRPHLLTPRNATELMTELESAWARCVAMLNLNTLSLPFERLIDAPAESLERLAAFSGIPMAFSKNVPPHAESETMFPPGHAKRHYASWLVD